MFRSIRVGKIALATVVAAGSVTAACSGGAALTDGTTAAQEVTARWTTAASSGNAGTVAALYTETARTMPPGGPAVSGRSDIESYWRTDLGDGSFKTTLTPTNAIVAGDILHVQGTYAVSGKGGAPAGNGQYEQLWTRAGGQWQIHREMWRLDPEEASGDDLAEGLTASWTTAYNGGDVKTLMALYHADATLSTREEGTLMGRPAIEGFWMMDLASGKPSSKLTLEDAYLVGNLAHLEGEYEVTQPRGKPIVGHFMQLWMREGTDWRIRREMWIR